ncbi:MAG: EthD domain-containing protein, partial [Pseudomonadota bacterium]
RNGDRVYKSYFFLEGSWGQQPFALAGEAASHAALAAVQGLAGYTQTRSLAGYNGEQIDAGAQAPYVGVAELWFASPDTALQSVQHAQALAPLLADGVNVGPIVTGRARTVMRLPAHLLQSHIKGVFPFRRKTGMAVDEFQQYWWLKHGPIAALTEQAVYYLQCHPLPETYAVGKPPYDGITELHWPDVDAARAAMASRQMREDQSNDAKNFADSDSVVLFLAEEEIVMPA